MGDWYSIGVALGVGLALGMALGGLLGVNSVGIGAALVLGATLGGIAGTVVDGAEEIAAGGLGGLLGALAAALVVPGALERGGTRLGVAAYLGATGLLVLLVAFVPAAGYVIAVLMPSLALRLRARRAARYAGLRTLAK